MPGLSVKVALPKTLIAVYRPGLMVSAELLATVTEPREVPAVGTGRLASGSGMAAAPVVGLGLTVELLERLAPPTTSIAPAVSCEPPLSVRAEDELESTATRPSVLMLALPVTSSAPLADGFRTSKRGRMCSVTPGLVLLLARKRPAPLYETVIVWLPGSKLDVINDAMPAVLSVAVPIDVPSS